MTTPEFHIRTNGLYWRPEAKGYTSDVRDAGRWSEAEALRLIEDLGTEKHAGIVRAAARDEEAPSPLTPHIAEARRAAALTLWAAVGGGEMSESIQLMQWANDLWPEPPLTTDKLADSPSPEAWRRASAALEEARKLQEAQRGVAREQDEAAEKLVNDFLEDVKS